MAHKQKGLTVLAGEWAKHLRPWYKRIFWKKQRKAYKRELRDAQG